MFLSAVTLSRLEINEFGMMLNSAFYGRNRGMAFSVLTEPVIPVLMCDGTHTSMGIRDVFLRAHEIRDIEASSPLERYALVRLLVAIAMDMSQLSDSEDRIKLWERRCFDSIRFDSYIMKCEQDTPRFNLFDEKHPFMQSPYDSKLDDDSKIKPVALLFHSVPSGNNHIFFDHRPETVQEVSSAEAFRALCTCYLFSVADKRGPGSVNRVLPIYCTILRHNLFETLVLNMLSEKESMPVPYGVGKVPWRNGREMVPKEEVASISMLEGLTWMPRRVTLISNSHQTVRQVYFQPGLKFTGDRRWKDPHVPYIKKSKKATDYKPLMPQLGRAVWRDAGCFLRDDGATFSQPATLRCMENVLEVEDMFDLVSVRASGLMTTQSKCEDWCEEELRLPSSILREYELAYQFRSDIATVEEIQNALFKAVRDYVDADMISRKEQTETSSKRAKPQEFALQCRQFFLHKAHDLLFGKCLDEICKNMTDSEHSLHFCDELRIILRETLGSVLACSGNDRRNQMKQLDAEKQVWRYFGSAVKRRRKSYETS